MYNDLNIDKFGLRLNISKMVEQSLWEEFVLKFKMSSNTLQC